MAGQHRTFVSFAAEDSHLRDFLVGQGRNNKTPFSFIDMSVKQPWDIAWKTNCRTKIRGCDAVIGIITRNTRTATGQLWELNCAYEEGIPVLLIHGSTNDRPSYLPDPVHGRRILNWTWDNIANFLEGL